MQMGMPVAAAAPPPRRVAAGAVARGGSGSPPIPRTESHLGLPKVHLDGRRQGGFRRLARQVPGANFEEVGSRQALGGGIRRPEGLYEHVKA